MTLNYGPNRSQKDDKSLIAKLRVPRKYPVLASRTKKYQSFVNFALLHYQ